MLPTSTQKTSPLLFPVLFLGYLIAIALTLPILMLVLLGQALRACAIAIRHRGQPDAEEWPPQASRKQPQHFSDPLP